MLSPFTITSALGEECVFCEAPSGVSTLFLFRFSTLFLPKVIAPGYLAFKAPRSVVFVLLTAGPLALSRVEAG